jgi:two-component system KDP operon response regulator KdpE
MKKRILVVDDEARMRRFMRMNLDLEGYDVGEAGDGLTALTKVREELPDLVLLDVMMPEMDGFETLERIRETSSVPVIMLTVKGDEEDRIRGLDLGADDYVAKPFSPRELSSRIQACAEPSCLVPVGRPLVIDEDLAVDFTPGSDRAASGSSCDPPSTGCCSVVENSGWIVPQETLLARSGA